MKTNSEIVEEHKVLIEGLSEDGGCGFIPGLDAKKPNNRARVVWSFGGGWDHVSVSWTGRCPSWDEMCKVKRIFFRPEEFCVEYHPAESEYVNTHPYCLHIWRPQTQGLPIPPTWMVGLRDGETITELLAQANAALR